MYIDNHISMYPAKHQSLCSANNLLYGLSLFRGEEDVDWDDALAELFVKVSAGFELECLTRIFKDHGIVRIAVGCVKAPDDAPDDGGTDQECWMRLRVVFDTSKNAIKYMESVTGLRVEPKRYWRYRPYYDPEDIIRCAYPTFRRGGMSMKDVVRKFLKRLTFWRTRWVYVRRYDTRPAIERGWTGELAARFLGRGKAS
ncbi:MAG: hypothetical protein IJR14_03930 [Synergistaceae bacterium]|nr:hypothetical protein [Synergistaceae bacterium]